MAGAGASWVQDAIERDLHSFPWIKVAYDIGLTISFRRKDAAPVHIPEIWLRR